MDESTINENSQLKATKPLLRIIGIEVGILLVVALLIIGILNYFNVFSVSRMSPQLFGRLPHQPYEVFTGRKIPSATPSITPSPTYVPVAEKIKKDIDNAGKEIALDGAGVPTQTLYLPTDVKNDKKYTYYSSVSTYGAGLSRVVSIGYNSSGELVDKQVIVNHIPKLPQGLLNNILAIDIAKEYLKITPGAEFECAAPAGFPNTKMQCESVWSSSVMQESIDIAQIGEKEIGVSYCNVEKSSPLLANGACAPGIK